MPLASLVSQSNAFLSSASSVRLVKERPDVVEKLARPGGLVEAAKSLLQIDAEGVAYLEEMPRVVQETIRVAIHSAVTDPDSKPVQLAYLPALEFAATVTDYGQAVTVIVRGPYEAASPGKAFAAARARRARRGSSRVARRVKPAKRRPAPRRAR